MHKIMKVLFLDCVFYDGVINDAGQIFFLVEGKLVELYADTWELSTDNSC